MSIVRRTGELTLCACGCGRLFDPRLTAGGRVVPLYRPARRYILGHSGASKKHVWTERPAPTPVACACDCGKTFPRRIYKNTKTKRWSEKRFIKGHYRPAGVQMTAEVRRRVAVQNLNDWHAKTLVPAAPVQRILRAKWGSDAARIVGHKLGVSRQTAHGYFRGKTFQRETAARLLALAADLPRTPSKTERGITRDRLRARQRAHHVEIKRASRARQAGAA